MRWLRTWSELLQEPHVTLVVELDVVDAVAKHRHALEPHAEREAGVLLGVDLHVREDLGIDHAGPADLDPARALAHPAAAAHAEAALHVDLGARLNEREVARAEPDPQIAREEPLHEVQQHA